MKLRHISILHIKSLIIVLLFVVSVNAQNDSTPKDSTQIELVNAEDLSTTNDSMQVERVKLKYGLRVGGDIGKLIRTALDDTYSGFEIQGDYRLKKDLYIAAEIGFEEKTNINDYLDITTQGSYIKAGVDFNMYENWLDMDNMIYVGFRVGASTFSHDLNSFTVYNTNQYWEPQFTSTSNDTFSGLTAVWAEVILGMKVEIFNNLFMGGNVQLKLSASESEPNNFGNVFIPGFGKTYDSSRIGVGYSYLLSYRIPLYKKYKDGGK